MIEYQSIHPATADAEEMNRNQVVNFLYTHLDEYGDEKSAISACLDYALTTEAGKGGFIVLAKEQGEILGAVIINKTGMGEYIPENILVYIAVRADQRGRGVGKSLMEKVIAKTEGDIALHVEPDNPAKLLYEKYGFTNKYLEMRLKK